MELQTLRLPGENILKIDMAGFSSILGSLAELTIVYFTDTNITRVLP